MNSRHAAWVGLVVLASGALAGCGADAGQREGIAAQRQAATASGGAIIRLDMDSTVGVLLDELPSNALKDLAASNAAAEPANFWIGRAERQTRLTSYRLIFRGQYYSTYWSNNGKAKGPLPLPPKSTWQVTLKGAPYRTKIDKHDLEVQDYHFTAYIVTDANSPGIVEPSLATVGGTWSEPFNLPADPELLLERTGYACMDEDEFPPYSVFEENTWYFYDDACTASDTSTCHVTTKVSGSCNAGLVAGPGHMSTAMNFTRLAYDSNLAAQYRVGAVNPAAIAMGNAPDLSVVQSGLDDERDIVYRFFGPGSCELGEGVISQYGWRRLLMFSAIVQNDGTGPVQMGNPTDPSNPYVQGNAFEFSACHGHYHFSHYGTFDYEGLPGSKRAFCLEDTNRYHNDETTALWATHQTCENQGIEKGWGDEYNFGIPGQWVDITTADTTTAHDLSFSSNPDQFICEGNPVLDANGNFILDPTSWYTQSGLQQSRIRCNFLSNWSATNSGATPVSSPGGSFVTDACTRGQLGPNRDCGFQAPKKNQHACTTGAAVSLTCTASGAPQVLRLCEKSGQLAVGVACTLADSIANVVVDTKATSVSFTCPAVRDAQMVPDSSGTLIPTALAGVGGVSAYQAALGTLSAGDDKPGGITCSGW